MKYNREIGNRANIFVHRVQFQIIMIL